MDTAIQTVARGPRSGFLLRWLGAWMLATALSSFLLAVSDALDSRYRAGPAVYLVLVGFLSFPALGGLLHGIAMRGLHRRSTLWGALTGGGIVIAAMGIAVMFFNFHDLWWLLEFRVRVWIAKTLGIVSLPFGLVDTVLASVLFGLILGAIQAIVLAPRWWSILGWIATSIAASVLTGLWLYAWAAVEPISALFTRIAELMPLAGQWRYLPVSVLWAEVGVLCFALPTGLLMQRLLRRHLRADAEALVRRFE